MWLRQLLRLVQVTPDIEPPIPGWRSRLSKTVHLLLYALMISMPIAGWLILSGEGKAIPFYGFELPSLMAENKVRSACHAVSSAVAG